MSLVFQVPQNVLKQRRQTLHNRQAFTFCICIAMLLTLAQAGCRSRREPSRRADFVARILPGTIDATTNVAANVPPSPNTPNPSPSQISTVSYDLTAPPEIVPPGKLAEEIVGSGPNTAGAAALPSLGNGYTSDGAPQDVPDNCILDLRQAVAVAQSQNPQLGIARADIGKAAAGKKIAFSAFLPSLGVVESLNALDTDVRSVPSPVFAPLLPIEWNSQYNQIELETQWIIWDFGRRLGRYRQADIMVDIARLKYQRACQTVGYDATEAYYRVLLAYSTVVTAQNTLRRAEEYLRVAKNLFQQGEVDRESIYSAELQVAKARQECVSARTRVNTSTAQLNLAMGRNTLCPTRVRLIESEPQFQADLPACLNTAVNCRREIRVVSDWVAKTYAATDVAKADFMPKVISGASYTSTADDPQSDTKYGYIAFCWDIYTGGKRVGKLREEQADTDRAIANGRQVCDRIAFEVNFAYQRVDDAAKRIDLARSAVRLAHERLRIVMNKFEQGTDSPTDVVDAQTAMTVAEQRYADTIFALRSAIARLEYAMGVN